jgi:Lrp/AsnC family transcriptional regulator for asnA, asnC and gidA
MKDKRTKGTEPETKSSAAAKAAERARPQPATPDHLTEDAEINWKILSLLQEDGRMPFSTIAEKVGVSEGTVRNRVKQLQNEHFMEINAQVLPQAFGYNWNSTVFITLNAGADVEKVAQRLAKINEVYYVVQLTGPRALGVAAYHRDSEHFREFLAKHFHGDPDILSFEPAVNLKVFKMKLQWKEPLAAG